MKFPLSTLCILLFFAQNVFAAPKEAPTPPPPPMPQDQQISIYRGRTVEIPLRAIGRANGQLKFLIRIKPKTGKLGEIRFTGDKTAVVTYTHNESSGASADGFTYAVQGLGTAVSAPGRVQITVSENPPAFSVVHAIDFSTTMIGEPREEELTIRNTGGGIITGVIMAPAPWKVLGDTRYQLGRKEEKRVRILFDPSEAREYTEKLVFSHDARSAVTLTGSATSPFELEPSRDIELTCKDAETIRSGGLIIRNTTERERVVDITAPARIAAPDQVLVGAKGEARVPFHTPPDFLEAIDGEVVLESEGFRRSIDLHAQALRPILQVEPKALDFGRIPAGQRRTIPVEIKNTGGTPARLRILAPPDLLLAPDPNTAVIEPGQSRTFQAILETSAIGAYRFELEINAENISSIRIPVDAQVANQPAVTGKIVTSPIAPLAPEPARAPTVNELYPSDVPKIEKVEVQQIGKRAIEVSWHRPAPNAESVVIEQRMLGTDGVSSWKTLDNNNIKISDRDDKVVVRFENLAPGQIWFLRFSSLDQNGHQSVPSATVRLASVPWKTPVVIWICLAVILAAGAGFFAYKFYKARQVDTVEEASRMARIEGGG